jgi:hypothetical protein
MTVHWFTRPIGHLAILQKVYKTVSFFGISFGEWAVGVVRCRK